MGTYLNPGNSGFQRILKSKYVDKTGMIGLINRTIDTADNLICVSRPRRFGKSYAAQMLCAYYDKSCKSEELFKDLIISEDSTFYDHLNKYDVIYLDMTSIKPYTDQYLNLVPFITDKLTEELMDNYKKVRNHTDFPSTLLDAVNESGNKIIMIIDEWDAPIRENPAIEREYLEFLRTLFKSSGTTAKIFAAAYMTGILPIKKNGSQSAVSEFEEYTMLKPYIFGKYIGFTENEVMDVCEEYNADFQSMKQWYDGYNIKNVGSVYNPNSVMKAIKYEEFDSYWTESSAAKGLMEYINKDYSGMTKTVAELMGGIEVSVDTGGFENDMLTFRSKDDVLTLMIHLGYLSYDSEKKTVRIPNEEIRREFSRAVRETDHKATLERLRECDKLFEDTINGNEEAVAAQIEKIHAEETAPLHYNREASLRSVIKLAYYTYRDHYIQLEELPSGTGYADIVYLPKPDSGYPALLIELKWDKSAESAIEQIRMKNYPAVLKDYGEGIIILVGINYNSKTKEHSCVIEEYDMSETL